MGFSLKDINVSAILVLLGIFLELMVLTWGRHEEHYLLLPIFWVSGGVLASVAAVFYSFKRAEINKAIPTEVPNYFFWIFVILAILVFAKISVVFFNHPADPMQSDVVPTLQFMAKRLVLGESPYQVVEFPGWSFQPGYLTMQFLPFALAELLKIDYRVIAFIAFVIMIAIVLKKTNQTPDITLELIWNIFKIILPFVSIYLIIRFHIAIFAHSVELLDVAYYLLLAYSLFSKSIYLRSFAIAVCLLSRYGILLWLPAYALIYYWEEGWHKTLKLAGIVVALIIVLYVLPFMTQDPFLFFNSLKNYDQMAEHLWSSVPEWYQHIGKPYTLAQGLGFAIYFLDFWDGTILEKISAIKMVHIVLSLSITMMTIVVYYFKKEKIKDTNLFLLGSMCLYLTIFYNFVFAPYSYLFVVPFFVLFVILYKIPIKVQNG